MIPVWFDLGAKVWWQAQHTMLDQTLTMMQFLTGGQGADAATSACICGAQLETVAHPLYSYQRCPSCGLIRFHAPMPHLAAGSEISHRVLAFPPRSGR